MGKSSEHFPSVTTLLLRCAHLQHSQQNKMMKAFLIFFLIDALSCFPGGYTGAGGMYHMMNQTADYMPMAVHAANMAKSLERDESLLSGAINRGLRQTVYVPTFFSSVTSPELNRAYRQLSNPGAVVYRQAVPQSAVLQFTTQ